MRFWPLLLITLIFISGCVSQSVKTDNTNVECQKEIAKLPGIISENTEGARLFEVARIVDGDTIELGNGDKVRLIGINTPEENENNYAEASDNLEKLITGRQVYLQKDISDKDKYGRLLKYVFTEDKFVNAEQVSAGLASSYKYPPDTKFQILFDCLEADAKAKGLGIWQGFGTYNFSISIKQNANGSSEPNDEYIVLTNLGNEVNMTGWLMKDEATHIYTFYNTVLGNGESITIYSGKGNDLGNLLYWNQKTTVWNNDGDTVFIRDSEGNLAAIFSY